MAYFILLLAILFPWGYGNYEAGSDYLQIQADAGNDSLHETFHGHNLLRRGLTILLFCVAVAAALYWLRGFGYWCLPVLLCYCSAAFGYQFTSKLNTLRGLGKWYVSRSPRASKTDRLLVYYAAKAGVTPASFSGFVYTVFLIAGILVLAAGMFVFCG